MKLNNISKYTRPTRTGCRSYFLHPFMQKLNNKPGDCRIKFDIGTNDSNELLHLDLSNHIRLCDGYDSGKSKFNLIQ